MSYGIIRVQKFKAAAVRGIQSHDRRERESHSNPDIDQGRSAQNYTLVECGDLNGAIRERLETLESSKAVRKDAVVMAQCLVTSDHDFFKNLTPDKQRAFFEQSLAFISDRYGKDNILSATVHMDEKTPHMHVNLTPIRDARLTAKEIFNRQEFNSIHTDFHKAVGREWGLERGETKGEKRKHLDTEAYKLETRKSELVQEAKKFDIRNFQHAPPGITAEDLKPKKMGLLSKETPEAIAERLTEKFVNEHFQSRYAFETLKDKLTKMEDREKRIQGELEDLDAYRSKFGGLTPPQYKALDATIKGFREENSRMKEERDRLNWAFDKALRNTPGTALEHLDKRKELMDKWEKADDKRAFEKAVLGELGQQQGQDRGRGGR